MYLQCDNQGHVEKWLADFHRRKNPDRDNKRRHATQLELWVSEAKVLFTIHLLLANDPLLLGTANETTAILCRTVSRRRHLRADKCQGDRGEEPRPNGEHCLGRVLRVSLSARQTNQRHSSLDLPRHGSQEVAQRQGFHWPRQHTHPLSIIGPVHRKVVPVGDAETVRGMLGANESTLSTTPNLANGAVQTICRIPLE